MTILRSRIATALFLIALLGLVRLPANPGTARAEANAEAPTEEPQAGPDRTTIVTVSVKKYEWWLSRRLTNEFLCSVTTEDDGLPTSSEILEICGSGVHTEWKNTKSCPDPASVATPVVCGGVFLHLVQTWNEQRDITVELDPPSAWISITGCDLSPPDNICYEVPNLIITGEEPLPNESIISIQGALDGEPFSCMGAECVIPMPSTGMQGIQLEFWAESSFGDASEHFIALVRIIPWGNFAAPEGSSQDDPKWYVDILSTQWRGAPLASCAQSWESFPDLGGPPAWLTTPERVEGLYSTEPYYYLAGLLIQNGQVDAADCPSGGLETEGIANACGLERAQPAVIEWQNQFDTQIIDVALESGVPAQLMKNIFARESQFWPGIFRTYREAGLGQLTENGADTVLLWDPTFYNQFCPLIFEDSVCMLGFSRLGEAEQNILKGALVSKVNASCPDCPAGIDLSQADFSVNVFAKTLWASCEQAGQIVYNTTGAAAGLASSYVDLWRFTLVNYNAGPGCLYEAINETYLVPQPLSWENVSAHLDEACRPAIDYITDVTSVEPVPIEMGSLPGLTPTQTETTIPSSTPAPTSPQATPSPTVSAYVQPEKRGIPD